MTKQQTFSALLAVAVALLGVDLTIRLSPQEAVAQEPTVWPPPPVPEPTVVSVSSEQIWVGVGSSGIGGVARPSWRITRAWSDGQVDVARVVFNREFGCTVTQVCPPVVIIPAD